MIEGLVVYEGHLNHQKNEVKLPILVTVRMWGTEKSFVYSLGPWLHHFSSETLEVSAL